MAWRWAPGLLFIITKLVKSNHYNQKISENHDKRLLLERVYQIPNDPRNYLRNKYGDHFWDANRIYFQSCNGNGAYESICENCVDVVASFPEDSSQTVTIPRLDDFNWNHVEWRNPYTHAVWLIAKKDAMACIKRVMFTVDPGNVQVMTVLENSSEGKKLAKTY